MIHNLKPRLEKKLKDMEKDIYVHDKCKSDPITSSKFDELKASLRK